jgi:protein phosphatase
MIQTDLALRSAGASHIGKVRSANQDVVLLEPELGLYVVLDGMGGHKAGDVAARLAGDVIRDFVRNHTELPSREQLEAAIKEASAAVFGDSLLYREYHDMGTTVVACLMIDAQRAVIAHVGDSRAYLCRDGQLQRMTRDHTVVQTLIEQGLLSAASAAQCPYKNVLSRSLGSKTETQVDCVELELEPGDRLLLCSDGLYGYAAAEAIQDMLESDKTPEHVVHDLIECALLGGGGDNVTALVIETVPLPRVHPANTPAADRIA